MDAILGWFRRHPFLGLILLVPLLPLSPVVLVLYLILQAVVRKQPVTAPTPAVHQVPTPLPGVNPNDLMAQAVATAKSVEAARTEI